MNVMPEPKTTCLGCKFEFLQATADSSGGYCLKCRPSKKAEINHEVVAEKIVLARWVNKIDGVFLQKVTKSTKGLRIQPWLCFYDSLAGVFRMRSWNILRCLRYLLTRSRLTAPRPAGTSLRSCPNCLQAFSSFVKIFSEQEEAQVSYCGRFWHAFQGADL